MTRAEKRISDNYIIGNTALAYKVDLDQHQASTKKAVTKKRRNSINPLYTLMLLTVIIVMLLTCVLILKAQFQVATTSEQVLNLKNELTSIRRQNAHLTSRINEELDLVQIRETATQEYGMVYPTDSEVLLIQREATSYTVQYKQIEVPVPEKTSLGNILAFITRGW